MGEFEGWRRRAARWAADHLDVLRAADPDVPRSISNDRARDNWRILLSVADVVGGSWAAKAREIACDLAGVEVASESPRTLLLQDLKALFEERGPQLTSEQIVDSLTEMENRSWAEWRNGKAISKVGLARLLRPFDVQPMKWKEDGKTLRGYALSQFGDVFARYLDTESIATPTQSPLSPPGLESITYGKIYSPPGISAVATANNHKLLKTNAVARVASEKGECIGEWGEL